MQVTPMTICFVRATFKIHISKGLPYFLSLAFVICKRNEWLALSKVVTHDSSLFVHALSINLKATRSCISRLSLYQGTVSTKPLSLSYHTLRMTPSAYDNVMQDVSYPITWTPWAANHAMYIHLICLMPSKIKTNSRHRFIYDLRPKKHRTRVTPYTAKCH